MLENIIKTGSYELVSLVEGHVSPVEEATFRLKKGILGKVLSVFSGNRAITTSEANLFLLASNVIGLHKIGEADVARIPQTIDPHDLLQLAQIAVCLSYAYDQRIQLMKEQRINTPYSRGKRVSDFLEVIPPVTAAGILFAASTPDIAEAIYEGRVRSSFRGHDSQIIAIEGVVLLPRQTRRDAFAELTRLEPGQKGRARQFLSSVIGNFYAHNSKYSGMQLIYANLKGEEASGKVLEMQSEFQELANIIKANS